MTKSTSCGIGAHCVTLSGLLHLCKHKLSLFPGTAVGKWRHQTWVVRGTDPRRANTEALLPLSLAAHQNEF